MSETSGGKTVGRAGIPQTWQEIEAMHRIRREVYRIARKHGVYRIRQAVAERLVETIGRERRGRERPTGLGSFADLRWTAGRTGIDLARQWIGPNWQAMLAPRCPGEFSHCNAIAATTRDLLKDLDGFEASEQTLSEDAVEYLLACTRRIAGVAVALGLAVRLCAPILREDPDLLLGPAWCGTLEVGYDPKLRKWVKAVHAAAVRARYAPPPPPAWVAPAAPAAADGEVDEPADPPLSRLERLTLDAMYTEGSGQPLSIAEIVRQSIVREAKVGEKGAGEAVAKFISLELAEKPLGEKGGVRLTMAGKRLARKLGADK